VLDRLGLGPGHAPPSPANSLHLSASTQTECFGRVAARLLQIFNSDNAVGADALGKGSKNPAHLGFDSTRAGLSNSRGRETAAALLRQPL